MISKVYTLFSITSQFFSFNIGSSVLVSLVCLILVFSHDDKLYGSQCFSFFCTVCVLRALSSVAATLQHCSAEHQVDLVDAIRRYSKQTQHAAPVRNSVLEMMALTVCFFRLLLLLLIFKIWMTMDT